MSGTSSEAAGSGPVIAEPIEVADTAGPWARVRQSVAWYGQVVVYAAWQGWIPAALADPELRTLLGSRDWQRLSGLAAPEARARFAASRLMMRYTAGAALQVPPDSVELAYKPGGRPYLRGCDQLDVSLSHTGDLVVVALNRRGRIGVDTEPADRRIRYTAVERHLCIPAERRVLAELPEEEQERELLRIWTLKEAYTKALGQGMRMGFNQFGFVGGALLLPGGRPASSGEWAFATFELLGSYLVSVACCDTGFEPGSDLTIGTVLDEGLMGEILDLFREPPGT
ncbi:4'-phosphopantetheinyl transferase superfamily protein [Streptacidiphilus sp. ASG 303]|uniref:4'-phosphopantetheinyl transferase family protein n=1 Tax=Streptacidiphilus sp. ASG 303 TaxID=2896847 RepID=UPI001E2DA213|nr:4'-phosphopantetheinyl transferase superfamily protein [Streptacidiphilus sp. ASG 303]MCD0486332.1 4'-phosphopantetheinyl transferase superfamily protein [Streptacidiphilus sp. ASG 303]